jgi:hypothetical protein
MCDVTELLKVFEYIDNSPVKASQIEDLREWRWGGLWQNCTGCRELVETPADWLRPPVPEHLQLLLTQ